MRVKQEETAVADDIAEELFMGIAPAGGEELKSLCEVQGTQEDWLVSRQMNCSFAVQTNKNCR